MYRPVNKKTITKSLSIHWNIVRIGLFDWYLNASAFPSMELCFLGNKYTKSNEPKEKSVVQLKYMGKAYQASMSNTSRAVTAFTYRGVGYSN